MPTRMIYDCQRRLPHEDVCGYVYPETDEVYYERLVRMPKVRKSGVSKKQRVQRMRSKLEVA